MGDDFSEAVKRALAARVGNLCSNPDCGALTSGPQDDPTKSLNLGVAAHITAASPGGPRYAPDLSPEERSAPSNGIWLCQNCGKLVDNDPTRFSTEMLKLWKQSAELQARNKVGKTRPSSSETSRGLELNRKPYSEDLERCVNQLLDQMTYQGWLLLRYLLMHEPIEILRPFMNEIPAEIRYAQMAIAMSRGVVRHDVKRQGAMTWTNYVVAPQFRPALENVLYKRLKQH
jgi:hypothetical protein